jgi:Uma2 family endonuclease
VEVEIRHSDIEKLELYAALGVPEFWRYNGKILRIYQLDPPSMGSGELCKTIANFR